MERPRDRRGAQHWPDTRQRNRHFKDRAERVERRIALDGRIAGSGIESFKYWNRRRQALDC
jgi:hypothetical protein